MPYQEIECAADGPIASLALNNSSKIHAPSATMVAEPTEVIQTIGKRAFCEQIDMGDENALARGALTIALNCLAEDARIGSTPFWRKQRRSGRTDRPVRLSLEEIIREGGGDGLQGTDRRLADVRAFHRRGDRRLLAH